MSWLTRKKLIKNLFICITSGYGNRKSVSINFIVKEPIFEAQLGKIFYFIPTFGPKTKKIIAHHQHVKRQILDQNKYTRMIN